MRSARAELEALRRTAGERVFFSAMRQGRLKCYRCVVSYDRKGADTHSAFDLASGTFTAPRAGHYYLQFHALAEAGFEAQVGKFRHKCIYSPKA